MPPDPLSNEASDSLADPPHPSAATADNGGDRPKPAEIIFVPKTARLAPDLPTLDAGVLAWKKDFWRQRIGAIKHVVAPMVDQSELAFRMLLRERGAADLCFTPMIHAHLFISDTTYRRGAFSTLRAAGEQFDGHTDRPLIVQFCANDPRILLDACRLVEGYCDGVDLNLGCPQLIAKRGRYGSFLQEFPDLVAEMIRMVHAHCRLPLSVKIRALADVDATVAYARKLVDAGAAMISVHGRVREQRGVNTGLADWRHIAAVKRAVDVPVIANGNIQLFGDVAHCLRVTGADAVMSAEGILNNPLLFTGRNVSSFDVARDYLTCATRYKAHLSAIRAHVFRICHHSLLQHDDLRAKTSFVFKIGEFRAIIDELERRTLAASNLAGAELLALDTLAQDQLAGQSLPDNWMETLEMPPSTSEEAGQVQTEVPKSSEAAHLPQPKMDDTLINLVNAMPTWVCKPYVRPSRPIVTPQTPNESGGTMAENGADGTTDRPVSAYRAARREEISRLVTETGLSRRKLRKRARRHKEAKRKAHSLQLRAQAAAEEHSDEEGEDVGEDGEEDTLFKKRKYPPCERCAMPAGANCELQLCKRCCKFTCVRMARDCKVHGFSHEKMHEKRVNYAQHMGISLEDLLKKETQDSERQKFLKNMKKTPLEYSVMHRDEAERRAKSAVAVPDDKMDQTESNLAE